MEDPNVANSDPNSNDEPGTAPSRVSPPGAPRWVKVFGLTVLVVIVLVVVLLLFGPDTFGPGQHGPGRHVP